MLVKITAGRGIGQVLDMPTAQAQARIAGGTAVPVNSEPLKSETAMLEQSSRGERMQKAEVSHADQPKRRKR